MKDGSEQKEWRNWQLAKKEDEDLGEVNAPSEDDKLKTHSRLNRFLSKKKTFKKIRLNDPTDDNFQMNY